MGSKAFLEIFSFGLRVSIEQIDDCHKGDLYKEMYSRNNTE